MKKFFILLLLAAVMCPAVRAQVKWVNIESASQVDKSSNKKMFFVDFSTSWCGWCKKMERETFNDPVVAAILNRYYVPVHFDAKGNASFSWNGTKYSNTQNPGQKAQTHPFTRAILGQKIGYPSFAIFNKDGGLKQILQGYQNAYDFSMILWYFCSGDNDRYTFAEYQQVFQEEIKPVMMKKLGLGK